MSDAVSGRREDTACSERRRRGGRALAESVAWARGLADEITCTVIRLALSQHVRDSPSQVAVPQLAFISRDVSASAGVAAETASHVFEGNNLQHSKRIRLPAISQDMIAELALHLQQSAKT